MATQPEESLVQHDPPSEQILVGGVSTDAERLLDRLAPLLHELIAWGLVRETGPGTFELPADVQQRLARLTAQQSGLTAQIYVGRKCASCGSMGVTRMVGSSRLCATCVRKSESPGAEPEHSDGSGGTHQGEGRSRWHRKAG